jgi:hypothetical protein
MKLLQLGVGQLTARADSAGQALLRFELTSSSPAQILQFSRSPLPFHLLWSRPITHPRVWTLVYRPSIFHKCCLHKQSECWIFACADCGLTTAILGSPSRCLPRPPLPSHHHLLATTRPRPSRLIPTLRRIEYAIDCVIYPVLSDWTRLLRLICGPNLIFFNT